MKFKSVDALSQFSFRNATIHQASFENEVWTMELDGTIVKAENENNTRMEDMYCGTLFVRLKEVKVEQILEEGYKYYDANDVLKEEVPDTILSLDEYKTIYQALENAVIFDMMPSKDKEDTWELGVDIGEEDTNTYWITLSFSKSILEWDRYMNPVKEG